MSGERIAARGIQRGMQALLMARKATDKLEPQLRAKQAIMRIDENIICVTNQRVPRSSTIRGYANWAKAQKMKYMDAGRASISELYKARDKRSEQRAYTVAYSGLVRTLWPP